jgi:molybdopterin converting factor small subunit
MPITVALPGALEPYARGDRLVVLQERCANVREVLSALRQQWPGIVDRVLTEQGEIREHVNVFVGEESVRFAGGLAAPVAEGDTIEIIAAVSGG